MNIFSLQLAGMVNSNRIFALSEIVTPLGNMSHQKATFKMILLFQRWDMLVTSLEGAWQKKMKNTIHTKILTNGWTPQKYLIFLSKRSQMFHFAHHVLNPYFSRVKRKTCASLRRTPILPFKKRRSFNFRHEPPEVNLYTWDATKHKSWWWQMDACKC